MSSLSVVQRSRGITGRALVLWLLVGTTVWAEESSPPDPASPPDQPVSEADEPTEVEAPEAGEGSLPFPPWPLPDGYFSPFQDERAAWTWIDFKRRSILTFGRVCSFSQPIELVLCQARGKSHESIFEAFAPAQNIHAGALLLGADLPVAKPAAVAGGPESVTYHTARITVSWDAAPASLGATPERVSHRIEDLIVLSSTQASLPQVDWLFIGSYFAKVPKDWRNRDDTIDVYAADYFDWGIVTTYNTPGSVFDNPLPEGQNDELWYANETKLPPAGTLVQIQIDLLGTVVRERLVAPTDGFRPGDGDMPPAAGTEDIPVPTDEPAPEALEPQPEPPAEGGQNDGGEKK